MIRLPLGRALVPPVLLASFLLSACGGGVAVTPRPSGAEPPADCARVDAQGVITLSANDLQFSAPCMVAEAGKAFVIRFTNQEAVSHNVAVYTDASRSNEIMRGEIITGPAKTVDYPVDALAAGDYYFDCIVH
ncbi:MAG TPA: hypothetical protein VK838_03880, partial [Candidatus Limnocylindrales bacterium]|nr:hypothetical protein [Candidatus Limnocylindrales bacterium]